MFKVKLIDWVNGEIQIIIHFFESIAEALGFAKKSTSQTIKITDSDDQVIHHITNTNCPTDTYA